MCKSLGSAARRLWKSASFTKTIAACISPVIIVIISVIVVIILMSQLNRNPQTASKTSDTKITHVIFDLDGTLLDSVSTYRDAINAVVAGYGKSLSWKQMGRVIKEPTLSGAMLIVIEELKLNTSSEDLTKSYNTALVSLMSKTPLKPGAVELLKYFRKTGIPMGLCTAIDSKFFQFETKHLEDIFKEGSYFEVIVTAEDDADVARNKPHPDPYLVTMKKFKTPPQPSQVLVFEDSVEGVSSAVAAGTKCVMVCDQRLETPPVDGVPFLASLLDFKPELYGMQ